MKKIFLLALVWFLTPSVYASLEETISDTSASIVVIESDSSQGSGVLIGSSGLIVTNLHVLENADDLWVRTHSGERFDDVSVVDFDQVKDIALLKIKGFDLPTATLGNSNSARSGQSVIAIGAPQGLEQTVSKGIVSAVRMMDAGFKTIQTDAAISPGSSGGGLFNYEGKLIGILTAYQTDGQNLNFAVPINYVRGMMGQEVSYTEAQFLALNANTPNFGDAFTGASSDTKLAGWIEKLTGEYDIEIEPLESGGYRIEAGETAMGMWLFDDLLLLTHWIGDERDFTKRQLTQLLRMSKTLDYIYLSIYEGQLSANAEIYVPGSSFEVFEMNFAEVLLAERNLEEKSPDLLAYDYEERLSDVPKSKSRRGLRPSEPGNLDVKFYYQASDWTIEEQNSCTQFTSKRAKDKYAKACVETIDYEIEDNEEYLALLMDEYIKGRDVLSDIRRYESGQRNVQSRQALWSRYEGTIDGSTIYFNSTVIIDGDKLITLHVVHHEPDWNHLDRLSAAFFENMRL